MNLYGLALEIIESDENDQRAAIRIFAGLLAAKIEIASSTDENDWNTLREAMLTKFFSCTEDRFLPSFKCDICGELIHDRPRLEVDDAVFYMVPADEVGEFVAGNDHVVAHAQCGLDAGYPLA